MGRWVDGHVKQKKEKGWSAKDKKEKKNKWQKKKEEMAKN
jgi:hypothetical protein